MRSERHVFLGKPNSRKAILKRNVPQKTRTSASLKSVITRCATPICYCPQNTLPYALSLEFLFFGVSLESDTQRNVVYISLSSKGGPVWLCSKEKLWTFKLGPNVLHPMRPLIGVKFQGGFKAIIRCATPCLFHVQENLSWCIPSKFCKHQACSFQTSTAFLKFLICFHNCSFLFSFFFFFMGDDSLMCKRRMCVNHFIVMA